MTIALAIARTVRVFIRHANRIERFDGTLASLGKIDSVQSQRDHNVVDGRQHGKQVDFLENETHSAAAKQRLRTIIEVGDRLTFQLDVARIWTIQATENMQQSTLTTA